MHGVPSSAGCGAGVGDPAWKPSGCWGHPSGVGVQAAGVTPWGAQSWLPYLWRLSRFPALSLSSGEDAPGSVGLGRTGWRLGGERAAGEAELDHSPSYPQFFFLARLLETVLSPLFPNPVPRPLGPSPSGRGPLCPFSRGKAALPGPPCPPLSARRCLPAACLPPTVPPGAGRELEGRQGCCSEEPRQELLACEHPLGLGGQRGPDQTGHRLSLPSPGWVRADGGEWSRSSRCWIHTGPRAPCPPRASQAGWLRLPLAQYPLRDSFCCG